MQVVTQHFRPEFINRVDDIVVFHSLGASRSAPSWTSNSGVCGSGSRNGTSSSPGRGGAGQDRRGGIRHGLRRAPVEASHSVADREPVGAADPARGFRAGDRVVAKLTRDTLVFEKARLH